MIRSQNEIYERLDEVFEKVSKPMTCVELMDIPEIRAAALSRWGKDVQEATEKLSDTLGFMWRRGVINRVSAPASNRTKARFAYTKKQEALDPEEVIFYEPKARTKNKGDVEILQKDGEVILNFEKFTIVIKPR